MNSLSMRHASMPIVGWCGNLEDQKVADRSDAAGVQLELHVDTLAFFAAIR